MVDCEANALVANERCCHCSHSTDISCLVELKAASDFSVVAYGGLKCRFHVLHGTLMIEGETQLFHVLEGACEGDGTVDGSSGVEPGCQLHLLSWFEHDRRLGVELPPVDKG